MRKDQIKKRKEWQIKYKQHLKQQRAVYNLDNHASNNNNDENDIQEEIVNNDLSDASSPEKVSRSPSEISNKSSVSKVSISNNVLQTPSMDYDKQRSKSDPDNDDNDNSNTPKRKKKRKPKAKPNEMLTSPTMNNKKKSSTTSLTSASSYLTSPSQRNGM